MLLINSNQNQAVPSAILFLPDGSKHVVAVDQGASPVALAPSTLEPAVSRIAKNKKLGTPGSSKYVLLSKSLAAWGKVPRQQAEVAALIAANFEVGVLISEKELFDVVSAKAPGFPSLAASVQDPTYVFRYYRGLKNDGKYCGFIGRGFLRQEN